MKIFSRLSHFCFTLTVVFILGASPGLLNAQTLTGSYGSVFFRGTQIHQQFQPGIGGMGAVVLNNRIGLGAYGIGMPGSINFEGSDQNDNPIADMKLKMGYGGVYAEYFFIKNQRFRLSTPIKLGYGAVGVYDNETDEKIEKSRLLVLEPELHFDIRLGNHLAISLQSSYRIGDVKGLKNVSNSTISGLNFGIGLKMISQN
jgi:hypothetical protein